MNSEISKSIMNSHVSTWYMIITTGGVSEMPSLKVSMVVIVEVFFSIPLKILNELLCAKVVRMEIKITIHYENLDISLL